MLPDEYEDWDELVSAVIKDAVQALWIFGTITFCLGIATGVVLTELYRFLF